MTTQFTVQRRIPCNPQQFWELVHGSREFGESVHRDHLGFGFEVLTDDKATGHWKTKVTPNLKPPEVLLKAAGGKGDGFYYVEEGHRDVVSNVYTFTITPSIFSDKVVVKGVLSLVPVGNEAVDRTVKVTIDAKIFGIGGIVETFVERSVKQSYENSAEFTDAWLAKKLGR